MWYGKRGYSGVMTDDLPTDAFSDHRRRRLTSVFLCAAVLIILAVTEGCATLREAEVPSNRPAFDLVGHRGARGLLPENSLPSFRKALEAGATTLEIDVVISKDSQVVVSHEPWMNHLICYTPDGTPITESDERSFNIFEMTYEEVAQYDCGKGGHPNFPRQESLSVRKPLLSEVIEMGEQSTRELGGAPIWYNIEIKSRPEWDGKYTPSPDQFMQEVYEEIVEARVKDRTVIQSFDMRPLRVTRRLDSSIYLALLVRRGNEQTLAQNVAELGFVPDGYNPNYHLVDKDLVGEAHERGIDVIPWTVNTLEEMKRLRAMGVDGIITDYPNIGSELLSQKAAGN